MKFRMEAWERRSMDRVEVHDGGLGEEAEREVSVFF